VIYATIDGFDPGTLLDAPGSLDHADLFRARGWRPVHERSELDRWMLAELSATAAAVVERMDAFDHFAAAGRISALVEATSNWFVRRSRDRFWASGRADGGPDTDPDKLDAYWTLYETLLGVARLAAPFVPFVTEAMWRNLAAKPFGGKVAESVHLADYPAGEAALLDELLVRRMGLIRDVSSLGRAARAGARLKVRQPLSKVEVILGQGVDPADVAWLESHAELVCDELNVRQFEICRDPDRYITRTVAPDLKRLGPKLGKLLPQARQALEKGDAAALLAALDRDGRIELALPGGTALIEREDVLVRTTAREGWAAAEGPRAVVVIAAELTPELVAEGLAREVIHAVQTARKNRDLEFTDRIGLVLATDAAELRAALERHRDNIASETLADRIEITSAAGTTPDDEALDVDGHALALRLTPLGGPGSRS